MAAFRYKAFISYSWKDKAAAEALHRALETWRAPKSIAAGAAGLKPIFRDRDEEAAGASLKAAIEDALDNSEFLIVICSPNSAASEWVNKEVAYFRKRRTPANVLCYVVAGDPAKDCFAPAILFDSDVDGTMTSTPLEPPLAADARAEGDGERLARLKLIAAMLGLGLDDLVRRDQQRRLRRLRGMLGGASAAAAVFAGIAAYAVFQRNVALENEALAKREAMKAERTAEFMVGLFAVPDPSESRGRAVTAREILDKGVKTIEADLADEPDVQASLMHTMGRSYTGLGLYPDAARILSVARDKRVEAKADAGDLYATEVALARAEFEKGDLDGAHEIYARLVKEAEDDIAKGGWRTDYATALIGMGETTLYRAAPEEAQVYYERARNLLEGRSEDHNLLAQALRGIANCLDEQGAGEQSEHLLSIAVGLDRPGAPLKRLLLASLLSDLASIEYRLGRISLAKDRQLKVVELNFEMLGSSHPEYLITANNLARFEFENGDLGRAKSRLSEVLEHHDALETYFGPDFAYFLNTVGEISASLQDWKSASDYFEQALDIVGDRKHRLRPVIISNLGASQCQLGNEKGLILLRKGRESLSDFYSELDWRYGVADEFESRCLNKFGDRKGALKLAESAVGRLQKKLDADHYFVRRAISWRESIK